MAIETDRNQPTAGSSETKRHQLHGISELVFLDRYALKDPAKDLQVGDTVVVLTKEDPKFPQKEVGVVKAIDGDQVQVELRSTGELFTQDRKKIDRPLETSPSDMWDRMARAIVEVEPEERKAELEKEFRWLLEDFRFSPGGRINTMLGTGQNLTAYNCYVVPNKPNDPEAGADSRQAIIDTLGNMVEIMSRGGGVGITLSPLRPRLSYVSGVNGRSSGSVSWGALFSFATGLVEQGGCFGPDERILTDQGLIPAAELADRLEAGEFLYAQTHEGLRPFTAFFRNGKKELFEVTTARGYKTRVSADHKMAVLRGGKIETIPLRELAEGDEVLLLLGQGVETGYVALDNSLSVELGVSPWSWLDEELAPALGAARGRRQAEVPEAVHRSPSSVVAAFLKAYFEAAGCRRDERGYELAGPSEEALGQIQRLLIINGIASYLIVDAGQTARLRVAGAESRARLDAFLEGAGDLRSPVGVQAAVGAQGSASAGSGLAPAEISRIVERLQEEGHADWAEQVQQLMRVLPDRIASIESVGESDVYDFEVCDVHLLSGGGIYTSNSRRGALMLILDDWHPDVLEFIEAKRDMGQITNANISVAVSHAFMKAVEEDLEWDLIFPDTSDPDYDRLWDGNIRRWRDELGKPVKVHQTIRARKMWETIMESAWASAEPGVVFLERMNELSNSWYFEDLISTNPCGEQPLPAWGVCNLGHINLSRFARGRIGQAQIDWESLRRAVRLGVRFLDNVIDITPYFFEENERVQKRERRVGMGTLGLGELLVRMGVAYGSEESIEIIDRLYSFIAVEAYHASIDLAVEKGPFPKCDNEKFIQSGFMKGMPEEIRERVRQHGIRNVCILTQAPTGSTGTMIGTSTGIEPYYSWTYWRNSRLGMREVKERIVQEFFGENPELEPKLENLPDYFVTAMDLQPRQHIRVQAAIQRWTDSSISKTANAPSDYTLEQTQELYEYAYKLGCKGVTIYRDGSRDQQVLSLKEENETKAEADPTPDASEAGTSSPHPVAGEQSVRMRKRPQRLQGSTYEWETPLGTAFITVNEYEGEPIEVFVNIGKAGSDVAAMSEALGRLTTIFLRFADMESAEKKVQTLVKHLSDIGGSGSVGFGQDRVLSVPDAMAKTLRRHMESNGNGVKLSIRVKGLDLCPACGQASLRKEEGCVNCVSCGFSRC